MKPNIPQIVDGMSMKTRILIIIAVFLACIPWIFHASNHSEIVVDGFTTSSITVWSITIILSFVSWFLLSWAAKNLKETGILLSIITGVFLVIPFVNILGPMAGIILGVVAGFVAFMFEKYMTNPARKQFLIIAIITLVAAYSVLIILVLMIQPIHVWDTGDGIGSWTGTPEGIEKSPFVPGAGSIDLDPDLSPSYAFDFMGGLLYHTILSLPGLGVVISALFLVPYFILKRKNIPSRPYLALIFAGLLLFLGIPSFVSSLQIFAIMLSQPESIHIWVFDYRFHLHFIPIIVLVIAGILLYRSSIIRRLIRK